MWGLVLLLAATAGWGSEHSTTGSVASREPQFAQRMSSLSDAEPTIILFGHLRYATVQQVADSILVLERNGRFPEARELRRQFGEGIVGIDPQRPPGGIQVPGESPATLQHLREQLSQANLEFLDRMRAQLVWTDRERQEYEALVQRVLEASQNPPPAPPVALSRLELLDTLLQGRSGTTYE